MIIVDTNVVSELMRPEPDAIVIDWFNRHDPHDLALTSITVGEIMRGIERLPEGKRKRDLAERFVLALVESFSGRIYAYDEHAALLFGPACAALEQAGIAAHDCDLMIVSIAQLHDAKIATRNVKDFVHCDVEIINPWEVH